MADVSMGVVEAGILRVIDGLLKRTYYYELGAAGDEEDKHKI